MKPIFLIGYMGCGKSTIGRMSAELCDMQFVDLDAYIESRYHCTVKEIFAQRGEAGFRDIERAMLHEAGEFEDIIIACGGGTPCFFDNMEWMNSHGTTVLIDTPIDRLHQRLKRGKHKRPLIADKDDDELRQFIVEALDKRMPFYGRAAVTFHNDQSPQDGDKLETARRFADEIIRPRL